MHAKEARKLVDDYTITINNEKIQRLLNEIKEEASLGRSYLLLGQRVLNTPEREYFISLGYVVKDTAVVVGSIWMGTISW